MVKKQQISRQIECRHGLMIEVKPLRVEDIPELGKLHRSLAESERALLPEDVLDPHYEHEIRRQIEDHRVHRLVAWQDGKIIGSAAMRPGRQRWMSHTMDLRVITHPKYRRYGIAMVLMRESIPYAQETGIEKICVQIMPAQRAAINLFKHFGFRREATLRDFVKDQYNSYHDIRIYSMNVEGAGTKMEELLSSFHEYSG
ncbi:MAG: GNAT family N-acetyltransferase [bacterium]|nr:GNAT family N-acetyltransferase [bacterium]